MRWLWVLMVLVTAAPAQAQLRPLLDPEGAIEDCVALDPAERPGRTIDVCSSVVDGDPRVAAGHDLIEALMNRGIAWRELGKFDSSVADLQKASALAPDEAGP